MKTKNLASGLMAMLAATGVIASDESVYNPGSFFQSKTVIIPHDDKIHRGGEDSADSTDTVLAVADGVGGWATKGINPGLFSAELTRSVIGNSIEFPDMSAHELGFTACYAASTLF